MIFQSAGPLYCVEHFGVTRELLKLALAKPPICLLLLSLRIYFIECPILGPTGLPQYLYEAGWASRAIIVACTQTHCAAATSVTTQVAQEVGSVLGDEVCDSLHRDDWPSNPSAKLNTQPDLEM